VKTFKFIRLRESTYNELTQLLIYLQYREKTRKLIYDDVVRFLLDYYKEGRK
jgi:hypothetical protein